VKADRLASQVDRVVLADVGPSGDEREVALKDATRTAVGRVEAAGRLPNSVATGGTLRIVTPENPLP
jgi:hypothetical protein